MSETIIAAHAVFISGLIFILVGAALCGGAAIVLLRCYWNVQ